MLTSQAHLLDMLFSNLVSRAGLNAGSMKTLECFLKLALRAQSQSRATWETLAQIQNPPLAKHVGQANIAHGHQQVNNGYVPEATRPDEKEIPPNELLELNDGERLDTRATGKAGRADQDMETVESEHGPNVRRRKK